MGSAIKLSVQYKILLPWLGPVAGLVYGYTAGAEAPAAQVLGVVAILSLLGIVASWLIGRNVLTALTYAIKSINATANGDYSYAPPSSFKDELGHLLYSLINLRNSVKGRSSKETTAAPTSDAIRLISALEVCDANVMVADNDLTIRYMNASVRKMMEAAESDIKKELPNFSLKDLIGFNVDGFHKNPAHQRGMVKNLSTMYKTQIVVGGRTFKLIANPIFDDHKNRLGTVIEWNDMTEELAREHKEKVTAMANARIKRALDAASGNAMIADENNNIIYMNKAVTEMLENAESDLRQAMPGFDVSKIMGGSIDRFHKNPAHQKSMLSALKNEYRTQIVVGVRTFNLIANPIFDEQGTRLGTVVEWLDNTEALKKQAEIDRISRENLRVKLALDTSSGNTMIADADNKIMYMNRAVSDMMKTAESDLRKVLPGFDANNIIGQSIDRFHKNPAHQQSMVASLKDEYRTQITVGERIFALIANPIFDDKKERIGTVVEWRDRTQEVAVEREVDGIIEAAVAGDLSIRARTDNKEGFFLDQSNGINKMVGIVEGVVEDTVRVLDALAHGRLTEKIDNEYQGIFGKLKNDANTTVDRLTDIIGRIRHAANTVSTGADEIAQGNADLSQRTEEQASSLEETASSMEEMTSSVKQTSENAMHANELAQSAQGRAQKGGQVVGRAVKAMEEINTASKKISDIIGVIDEIAFQTNLLALNAAVEAARAGEQGKGFAVVAGEVRNLAQRSAGAAKEIKDLIRDSVEKVDNGTELVNESGETLNEIVEAVTKVTSMIKEISAASEEQASGIEQVNKAVTQMDEMTQQNAALVEEASAASETMTEQARNMLELVNFFKMAEGSEVVPTEVFETNRKPAAVQQARKPVAKAASAAAPKAASPRPSMRNDDDEWAEF
ncbi:MAG: PAS domain-containing protein [Oceanospirillaceae bacterium]|nr:PAS domain-containing protein [Oceanospirillaceae bacterium]MCP5350080.1 PAS domain-containing protein [Oceanospirillaceae bacterium]